MKREFPFAIRVLAFLLVMAVVALVLPARVAPGPRLLISWNAGVIALLALVLATMIGADPEKVRARAQREREGRGRVLAGILVICLASLVAVGVVLYNVQRQEPGFRLKMLLSMITIFMAWLFMQTMFAQLYARYYYRPGPASGSIMGGLRFPGDEHPDYWDFLYFSYTIGTNFSTSDTNIESRTLRRAVLLHTTLSFLFNTILIGLVINAISALF